MTFYFDASVPVAVAKALELVRSDIRYPGQAGCPISRPDVPDEDWLRIAGENQWIVVMRDKRIRSRPGERKRLVEHRVRAFCLTTGGNASRWTILESLVRHWRALEDVSNGRHGPFIYAVTWKEVRELRLV